MVMIREQVMIGVSSSGDVERGKAIRAAYVQRARQLWGFARRLGLDPVTAEDVMQEAFLRAMREEANSIENLDAWLFRVVHNTAVDRLRRGVARDVSRVSRYLPPGQSDTPFPAVDERLWLWSLVDQLPERQRAVIYLRFRADFEFRTIARIMGISEGGAKSNGARALTSLRERMADHEG